MIAVSLFGREVNGKRRWLGVGSASFQPTELVKITVIVAMAALMLAVEMRKLNQMIREDGSVQAQA